MIRVFCSIILICWSISGQTQSNNRPGWVCVPDDKSFDWECGPRDAPPPDRKLLDQPVKTTPSSAVIDEQEITPVTNPLGRNPFLAPSPLRLRNQSRPGSTPGPGSPPTTLGQPENGIYSLKLAAVSDAESAANFAKNFELDPSFARQIITQQGGNTEYLIVYGRFDSEMEARLAANRLPSLLQAMQPQAINISALDSEPQVIGSSPIEGSILASTTPTPQPPRNSPPKSTPAIQKGQVQTETKITDRTLPLEQAEQQTVTATNIATVEKASDQIKIDLGFNPPESATSDRSSVQRSDEKTSSVISAEEPEQENAKPTMIPGRTITVAANDQQAAPEVDRNKPLRKTTTNQSDKTITTEKTRIDSQAIRQRPVATSNPTTSKPSSESRRPQPQAATDLPKLTLLDNRAFAGLPDEGYTIQLGNLSGKMSAEQFIQRYQLSPDNLYLLEYTSQGRTRRTICAGSFKTLTEANNTMQALPKSRGLIPWVRRVKPLKSLLSS